MSALQTDPARALLALSFRESADATSLRDHEGPLVTTSEAHTLDAATVAEELSAARLAYGAALVGEAVVAVECVDEDAFEDGYERSLLTALTTVGADLVPLVDQANDGADHEPVASPDESSGETQRVTEFEDAVDALADASACYVVLDLGEDQWRLLRDVNATAVEEGSSKTPAAGRQAVVAALVEAARERTAAFDVEVDDEEPIRPITWQT